MKSDAIFLEGDALRLQLEKSHDNTEARALLSELNQLHGGRRARFSQARSMLQIDRAAHGEQAQREASLFNRIAEWWKQITRRAISEKDSYAKNRKNYLADYPHFSSLPGRFAKDGREHRLLSQRFGLFGLEELVKEGIVPIRPNRIDDPSLKTATAAFEKIAEVKTVTKVDVPGHAMLLISDPFRGRYLFFDPNMGILKFNSPRELAEVAARIVVNRYNGMKRAPGNPFPHISLAEFEKYMAVPINQNTERGANLGEGICNGLCIQVAKRFLQNPETPLSARSFGLEEFKLVNLGEVFVSTPKTRLLLTTELSLDPDELRRVSDPKLYTTPTSDELPSLSYDQALLSSNRAVVSTRTDSPQLRKPK